MKSAKFIDFLRHFADRKRFSLIFCQKKWQKVLKNRISARIYHNILQIWQKVLEFFAESRTCFQFWWGLDPPSPPQIGNPVCHAAFCDYELSLYDVECLPIQVDLRRRVLPVVKSTQRPQCPTCLYYVEFKTMDAHVAKIVAILTISKKISVKSRLIVFC